MTPSTHRTPAAEPAALTMDESGDALDAHVESVAFHPPAPESAPLPPDPDPDERES